MIAPIILASSSEIRASLLRNAGVSIDIKPVKVDESLIRDSLIQEDASPRDVADTLAELKASRCAAKVGSGLVLGCDQVLACERQIFGKPNTVAEARDHLVKLRGKQHQLLSAAVLFEDAKPVWRHVSTARLTMRSFSDEYIEDYLERNWESIQHSVGGYKLEEEGVRLFSRVDGDYFTILGLPLLELLSYLSLRGVIPS